MFDLGTETLVHLDGMIRDALKTVADLRSSYQERLGQVMEQVREAEAIDPAAKGPLGALRAQAEALAKSGDLSQAFTVAGGTQRRRRQDHHGRRGPAGSAAREHRTWRTPTLSASRASWSRSWPSGTGL